MSRKRNLRCALLAALLATTTATAGAADWQLAHEDNFNRRALGTDWLILRGDWHINAAGQLQVQRQWTSHSFIASNIPLRGKNVRAEFDFMIPSDQAGTFGAYLQAGALGWGAGGIDDRVGLEVRGVAADPAQGRGEDEDGLPANVPLDQWQHMVISLVDGRYEVAVSGRTLARGEVPQGRSLLNSGLQFSACPGVRVDNLKIFTAPMATPLPEINAATPEENRRATIFAEKFYDPARPDCGFQAAIDALPPGGGVVILPKGEFTLRRFLEIRSHTTLMGQGPQTILRAMDVTATRVESAVSEAGVHKLVLAGPHDFRPGDAFSYDNSWGHPINAKAPGRKGPRHMLGGGAPTENRLLVLAVEGNTLTVNAPPPPGKGKRILHFFPIVCSYESEFADLRDLQLVGPASNPAGASGGFMTNPVTFGVTSNPRLTRLVIRDFPADGISAQGCDDARLLDNTISGTAQGMHPGTTTLRALAARNYAVDNRATGLFFCWYNTNGVYFRNALKNFTGYPDSGDVFNTLACNRLSQGMHITVGYNGCLFANVMPALTIFGPAGRNRPHSDAVLGPGGRTYDLPPRYFTIGHNRVDLITLFKYAQGNVIAANVAHDGGPTRLDYRLVAESPTDERPQKNIIAEAPLALPMAGLPEPIARTTPELPPALPPPILDDREFYDPNDPTCGFQKALDRLAATGGTLRLPGGRYALLHPLRLPPKVTLAGYGAASILLPRGGQNTLIILQETRDICVRDLAIEGPWRAGPAPGPAVSGSNVENVQLLALDVRGWNGPGIGLDGVKGLTIRDCRVLRCSSNGYYVQNGLGVLLECNSAVSCGAAGFLINQAREVRLCGNIAALNQGDGFRVSAEDALLAANSASNNLADGILVAEAQRVTVAGNTCAGNNQCGRDGAGIRIGAGAVGTRVLFNNCGDEQLYATQLVGIREEAGAAKSEIRYNVTATLCTRRGHEGEPSLIAAGRDSLVADNWTETILPSNDSLESIGWRQAQPKQ